MNCVNSGRFALSLTLDPLSNNPVTNNHRKFQSWKWTFNLFNSHEWYWLLEKALYLCDWLESWKWCFSENVYIKYYSVKRHLTIPHFRNSMGRMGTSFGYNDLWDLLDGTLSGFKATINQSWVTLVHRNYPRNRWTESFYPFPLQFREWGMSGKLWEGGFFRWYDSYKSCNWLNYISLWTLRICVEGGFFEWHDSCKSCKPHPSR